MARVVTAFGAEPPVRVHDVGIGDANSHVVVEKTRRDVRFERRRLDVTDEREDDSLFLAHRVGLDALAADQRGLRVVQQRADATIVHVERKRVVPARDRVVGVTDRAYGKPRTAMAAAILDGEQFAAAAYEQDVFAEQLDRLVRVVGDISARFHRIPVIAEAELRLEPPRPGLLGGRPVGAFVVHVRHIGGGAFDQVFGNRIVFRHNGHPRQQSV